MAEAKKSIDIIGNDALTTVFVDHVAVSRRNDDMFYIRFNTAAPDGLREQVRVITTKKALNRIMETFTKALAINGPGPEKSPEKLPPKK